jgi:hypothetical protein
MSNVHKITKFSELSGLTNTLCNTVDTAMQASSIAMSDSPCRSEFKDMGKMQEAYEYLVKARILFREFESLDANVKCVAQLEKEMSEK